MKNWRTSSLAVLATVAAALLLVGCNDSTPTEPRVISSTPVAYVPPPTWTGTFSGISLQCNSSASVLYLAGGPLPTEASVACLNGGRILLQLSRQGNALTGYALWGDPEFYPITGTLTDSAMDMTIFNDTVDFPSGPTGPMGTMHLHP